MLFQVAVVDASFLAYGKDLVLDEGTSSAEVEFALLAMVEGLVVMQLTLTASIALGGAVVFHHSTSHKLKNMTTRTFGSKFMSHKTKFTTDVVNLMILNLHKLFEFGHTIMRFNITPVEGNTTFRASLFETWTNLKMFIEVLTKYAILQFCTPIGATKFGIKALSYMNHRIFIDSTILTDRFTLLMLTFEL